MAPFAIVAPFLGPFIDRMKRGRRATALMAAGGRAVLAMFAAEAVQSLALFPMVFCLLVMSKAHGVAKASLVRSTVSESAELVKANSRLAVLAAVAGFAAAIPAGIILNVPFLGADWVLRIAAVLFGASALAATQLHEELHTSPPAPPAQPEASDDQPDEPQEPEVVATLAPETAIGIIRAATSMAVIRGIVGFLAFEIAFGFRRADISVAWVGVALATSALGSLAGSFLAPQLRRAVTEEVIVLSSLFTVAVAGFVAFWWEGIATSCLCAFAVGLAASGARLAFDSLVQRDSPEHRHGRAFARFEALFQLVWVVGAVVPVALSIPLRWGGFVVTCIAAGGAAFYAAEMVAARQRRLLPGPPS
jgi:hypothetical protein